MKAFVPMLLLASLAGAGAMPDARTVTDIDRNVDQTVYMAAQVRPAADVEATRYGNGDPIDRVADGVEGTAPPSLSDTHAACVGIRYDTPEASEFDSREFCDFSIRGPKHAAYGKSTEDFPVLAGPYLGQKPPGRMPEPFAPGIVSSGHGSVTISADGTEIYWADDRIYVTRLENGRWTEPRALPFSLTGEQDDGPKLSPDGRTLYFNSDRPRHSGDRKRERVWRVERTAEGWGEPRPLGPEINDEHLHWQVSVDPEGRLYFGSERSGSKGEDDIFVAEPRDGGFAQPVSLGTAVNSEDHEGSPFVSRDGRYMIFLRDSNLWVSFRGRDGLWKPSRRLDTPERAVCPYVSPDGKYLFFLRFDRDAAGAYAPHVYWMDASGLGLGGAMPAGNPRPAADRAIGVDRAAAPVVDGHNHEGITLREGAIDVSGLASLREKGIGGAVLPLPVDRTPTDNLEARILDEIGRLRDLAGQGFGFTLGDGAAGGKGGGPASEIGGDPARSPFLLLPAIEWREGVFSDDIDRVRRYRELGVRMISLWDSDADGLFIAGESPARLSPRGRNIVSALNENGILIDITHLSHSQKLEVIACSAAPVVASHSLAQALAPNDFNLPEDVLTALASHRGSVWASFNRSELLGADPDEEEAMDRLVAQIGYLARRLGTESVGIGTDLQKGGRYVPSPLNRLDVFMVLRARLLAEGWEPAAVDGVLGGNVLRALMTEPCSRKEARSW